MATQTRRKRVLIPQPIHPDAVRYLKERFEVHVGTGDPQSLFPDIESWHAVLIRTARMPGAVIRSAKNLEIIARHGVGVDNIDVDTATACGIPVVNTPEANAVSVAEHVIGMMIAASKGFHRADRAVRRGDFAFRDTMLGVELSGQCLGIIGLGRVGSRLARIARLGFEMEVYGYDPYVSPTRFEELGVRPVESVEALLPRCDFVSLHIPLTPETKGMIGLKQLQSMKPSAVLVNAARGGLVDETALVRVLKDGGIRAAALDVFEEEPPPKDHPLWELPNLLVTPHMAAHTEEAMRRMAMGAATRIAEFLQGGPAKSVVNPDSLRR